ncbi:MAG TPA: hypothetical protein GX721_00570 [Firmicutes bacterium]|nr:hypothetical protein [Bacillota bacterium]
MRRKSRIVSCFALVCILLSVAGCFGGGGGGGGAKTYTVSGQITRDNGEGVEGVTLAFNGFGTTKTGTDGKWSKSGLKGTVTVTPARDGWVFDPQSNQVTKAARDVNFEGSVPDGIAFDDLDLESIVRELTGVSSGAISVEDVAGLTLLNARDCGISRLGGIEYFINLEELILFGNQIVDIGPLGVLTNLRRLNLHGNRISDISALAKLINLEGLYLNQNQITDISSVEGLTNLTQLAFFENQVEQISPVAGLTSLTVLGMRDNKISDLTPLEGLTNLELLYMEGNLISNLGPIAGLTKLTQIDIDFNEISNISALAGLTNLEGLYACGNDIENIEVLSELTKLWELYIWGNQIKNIGSLSGLVNLEVLWLARNQIEDISAIEYLTNLQDLGIHTNLITDISSLVSNTGFGIGDKIDIRANRLDLTPGSPNMNDIQTLLGRGVEVLYDLQTSGLLSQADLCDSLPDEMSGRAQDRYDSKRRQFD